LAFFGRAFGFSAWNLGGELGIHAVVLCETKKTRKDNRALPDEKTTEPIDLSSDHAPEALVFA
jgi:hypothetical protein